MISWFNELHKSDMSVNLYDMLFVTNSTTYDKKFISSKIIKDSDQDKIRTHFCPSRRRQFYLRGAK